LISVSKLKEESSLEIIYLTQDEGYQDETVKIRTEFLVVND
jgi:hypothetical protein